MIQIYSDILFTVYCLWYMPVWEWKQNITWQQIYNNIIQAMRISIYCWQVLIMSLNIFNLKLMATPETVGRYKGYITIFSILQGFKGRFLMWFYSVSGLRIIGSSFIQIGFTTLILFIGVFWILFTTLVLILRFNWMCFTTFIDICCVLKIKNRVNHPKISNFHE